MRACSGTWPSSKHRTHLACCCMIHENNEHSLLCATQAPALQLAATVLRPAILQLQYERRHESQASFFGCVRSSGDLGPGSPIQGLPMTRPPAVGGSLALEARCDLHTKMTKTFYWQACLTNFRCSNTAAARGSRKPVRHGGGFTPLPAHQTRAGLV